MPGTPMSGRQFHDPDDNDVSDREEVWMVRSIFLILLSRDFLCVSS